MVGRGSDESLSAANIYEVLCELDISGNVSPQMEVFARCLVSGPYVALWDRLRGKSNHGETHRARLRHPASVQISSNGEEKSARGLPINKFR